MTKMKTMKTFEELEAWSKAQATKDIIESMGYDRNATTVAVQSISHIGWGSSGSILGGIPAQTIYGEPVAVEVTDLDFTIAVDALRLRGRWTDRVHWRRGLVRRFGNRYGVSLAYANWPETKAAIETDAGRARSRLILEIPQPPRMR
jgi:hypothetical protein